MHTHVHLHVNIHTYSLAFLTCQGAVYIHTNLAELCELLSTPTKLAHATTPGFVVPYIAMCVYLCLQCSAVQHGFFLSSACCLHTVGWWQASPFHLTPKSLVPLKYLNSTVVSLCWKTYSEGLSRSKHPVHTVSSGALLWFWLCGFCFSGIFNRSLVRQEAHNLQYNFISNENCSPRAYGQWFLDSFMTCDCTHGNCRIWCLNITELTIMATFYWVPPWDPVLYQLLVSSSTQPESTAHMVCFHLCSKDETDVVKYL